MRSTGEVVAVDPMANDLSSHLLTQSAPDNSAHVAHVFSAYDIYVTSGANMGDVLTEVWDLCPGDIYQLDHSAHSLQLRVSYLGDSAACTRQQVIARGSQVGMAGDCIALSARLTLMSPDAQKVELLVLRHSPLQSEEGSQLYILPLTPLVAHTEYTLLRAEEATDDLRISDLMCLSFLRGSRILTASGQQVPIQHLSPGTLVLTRDHGPQPIRWIGSTTLRARGSFAPVVISKGALGNDGDLGLGPHHRLFHYQRERSGSQPMAETLIQAQLLVDQQSIYRREGGFAEYFSLVFDRHEIIYAEGIPVESLMVNEASVASLPQELAEAVRTNLPGVSQDQHFGTEADAHAAPQIRLQRQRLRRAKPQPQGAEAKGA